MASITKYFIGGEVEAFIEGSYSGIGWNTTAGVYDADFSRGAVGFSGGNSFYIHVPLTAPQTSAWSAWMEYRGGIAGGSSAQSKVWTQFFNSTGTAFAQLIGVGGTQAQPLVALQYWNGSSWVTAGTPIVVPIQILHKWDVQTVIDASTGVFKAYCDGRLVGSFSGDTAHTSPADFGEIRVFSAAADFNAAPVYISEFQIIDVSTLGRRLATLGETANGTNTAWTGSYTDINEVGTYNDTNFIQSGTANQVSTFVTTDLSATAQAYNVAGLVIAGRALNGATGPQNLKGAAVISGTTYITANNVVGPNGLLTVFGYVWADFPNNPATGIDFTPAELNAIETGWKSLT